MTNSVHIILSGSRRKSGEVEGSPNRRTVLHYRGVLAARYSAQHDESMIVVRHPERNEVEPKDLPIVGLFAPLNRMLKNDLKLQPFLLLYFSVIQIGSIFNKKGRPDIPFEIRAAYEKL